MQTTELSVRVQGSVSGSAARDASVSASVSRPETLHSNPCPSTLDRTSGSGAATECALPTPRSRSKPPTTLQPLVLTTPGPASQLCPRIFFHAETHKTPRARARSPRDLAHAHCPPSHCASPSTLHAMVQAAPSLTLTLEALGPSGAVLSTETKARSSPAASGRPRSRPAPYTRPQLAFRSARAAEERRYRRLQPTSAREDLDTARPSRALLRHRARARWSSITLCAEAAKRTAASV